MSDLASWASWCHGFLFGLSSEKSYPIPAAALIASLRFASTLPQALGQITRTFPAFLAPRLILGPQVGGFRPCIWGQDAALGQELRQRVGFLAVHSGRILYGLRFAQPL